jgi:hypothetical protein
LIFKSIGPSNPVFDLRREALARFSSDAFSVRSDGMTFLRAGNSQPLNQIDTARVGTIPQRLSASNSLFARLFRALLTKGNFGITSRFTVAHS